MQPSVHWRTSTGRLCQSCRRRSPLSPLEGPSQSRPPRGCSGCRRQPTAALAAPRCWTSNRCWLPSRWCIRSGSPPQPHQQRTSRPLAIRVGEQGPSLRRSPRPVAHTYSWSPLPIGALEANAPDRNPVAATTAARPSVIPADAERSRTKRRSAALEHTFPVTPRNPRMSSRTAGRVDRHSTRPRDRRPRPHQPAHRDARLHQPRALSRGSAPSSERSRATRSTPVRMRASSRSARVTAPPRARGQRLAVAPVERWCCPAGIRASAVRDTATRAVRRGRRPFVVAVAGRAPCPHDRASQGFHAPASTRVTPRLL